MTTTQFHITICAKNSYLYQDIDNNHILSLEYFRTFTLYSIRHFIIIVFNLLNFIFIFLNIRECKN